MKERITEAARLVPCRPAVQDLYLGRRGDGQGRSPPEGHNRLRPGLPGRDLRPAVEPPAGHRRAAREAHGDLRAGRDRGDPATLPERLRPRRPREGARAHAEGPADRRGDGASPPPPRALAHRHARPQLDGRARGGAPARARAVAAGREPARRAARHAEHVPARQPDSRHGEADPGRAVPARSGERGGDGGRRAHHRGGGGRQEAARAPLEERRAPGPPAPDHRGGAVGGDDHRGERRPDDHAGAAGGREDLGLPADAVKITFWLLVAIGCLYAFYSGAVAVYSYYQVKGIVRETVKERAGLDRVERADRIKQDILDKASQSSLPLAERGVRVIDENRTLRVTIRWSYPAIFYKGDAIVSIPISYDNSFDVPGLPPSGACLGLGDQLFDASALFAGRYHGDELLPGADRPRRVLLRLVEHLAAVEERGWIFRVDRQRAVQGLERRVRVATESDDEAQMGQRVQVLRVALEDRLV